MSRSKRIELIREIEQKRGTRVISYVTGDRPQGGPGAGLSLNIEPTVLPWIHRALRSIGKQEAIDLFLYTRGGAVDVVWPMVCALREYGTREFSVLVPFRAHSAGTLISLGADKIVMGEFGELTPVDPTTGNQFNPPDELQKGKRKGISVEDVTAYFDFARNNDKVKLDQPDQILTIFTQLTQQLHPLALGHVQRVHTQIRFLAQKLMESRRVEFDEEVCKNAVETLTEKLYSHSHAVTRGDARAFIGDIVQDADEEEGDLFWSLYSEYADDLELMTPSNALQDLDGAQKVELTYTRGVVETAEFCAVYETDARIVVSTVKQDQHMFTQANQQAWQQLPASAPELPLYIPGLPANINLDVIFEGWRPCDESEGANGTDPAQQTEAKEEGEV